MAEDKNNKSCETCKYVGFDSNLLGYCNNSDCKHHRHLVVNDSGSLIKNCNCYCDSNNNSKAIKKVIEFIEE